MSSELSNALNPYASQSRPRNTTQPYQPSFQPPLVIQSDVQSPPQQLSSPLAQYVPHRSELELAISEPSPPMPSPVTAPASCAVAVRPRASAEGVHAVQELLRIVSATKDAHERERQRRIAWEKEQEEKLAKAREETEREMQQLRETVRNLQSTLDNVAAAHLAPTPFPPPPPSGLITPQSMYNMSPSLPEQQVAPPPVPSSPVSPVIQPNPVQPPTFIQGSSTNPFPATPIYGNANPLSHANFSFLPVPSTSPSISSSVAVPQSVTPSPSPQLTFIDVRQPPARAKSPPHGKKRPNSELSSDNEEEYTSSSSSASGRHPIKRTNHHDRRILTIQHAMRQHMLRVMQIDSDKELPDSHQENVPIGPNQPVRFVWDKTTKQSVHNARMKARVIADIKEDRRLYKHVPRKDFGKKQLDAAFEASFTTFRAKFKAQNDNVAAENQKRREEAKGRKSRHLSRRKAKLANRADARMNIQVFQHETFGGAMQLDCMSSEESDFESDPQLPRPPGLLQTRGYAWRSTRLVQLYCTLDDEERADKSGKPKRGSGKRERCTGPPKEGFHLPPKGVASWMISRRWYKSSVMKYPDLGEKLQSLIHDPSGFDWSQYHDLGDETEDEASTSTQSMQHNFDSQQHNGLSIPQHHYTTNTSSLNYALV